MMAVSLALLAAGILFDGAVRSEVRAGSVVSGIDPKSAGVAADLRGLATAPEGTLQLQLSPSAILAQGSQLFLRGIADGTLRVGPGSIRLRQGLAYGVADLSPLSPLPTEPAPAQRPPPTRFVDFEESSTRMDVSAPASRRLRFLGSAGWTVSGGTDAVARETLPLARTGDGLAEVDWAATHLDTLRAQLSGLQTDYSNGRRVRVADLRAGWRRLLTRTSDLSVTVGPGVGAAQTESRRFVTSTHAVASIDYRLTEDRGFSALCGASVEPLGDVLTGDLIERGTLRGDLIWPLPGRMSLRTAALGSVALTSGAGTPLSPRAGDRFVQAELSAAVPLGRGGTISSGARGAIFNRPLPGQPRNQWIAFLNYTVALPQWR